MNFIPFICQGFYILFNIIDSFFFLFCIFKFSISVKIIKINANFFTGIFSMYMWPLEMRPFRRMEKVNNSVFTMIFRCIVRCYDCGVEHNGMIRNLITLFKGSIAAQHI